MFAIFCVTEINLIPLLYDIILGFLRVKLSVIEHNSFYTNVRKFERFSSKIFFIEYKNIFFFYISIHNQYILTIITGYIVVVMFFSTRWCRKTWAISLVFSYICVKKITFRTEIFKLKIWFVYFLSRDSLSWKKWRQINFSHQNSSAENSFSCLDHTIPVLLFCQLYIQENSNLNITSLVQ